MRIKEIRESRGMTQAQLAAKLELKQSSVANWERKVTKPDADNLPKIADALCCTIDALFGRNTEDRAS